MTQAQATWRNIGNGNLGIMKTNEGWLFYPEPTTYVLGVNGSQGKEFRLGSKNAYQVKQINGDKLAPESVSVSETEVQIGTDKLPILKANGHTFIAYKDKTKRVKSGEVVVEAPDKSNLWVLSESSSTLEIRGL